MEATLQRHPRTRQGTPCSVRARGFSLIELLTVTAIIAILVGMLGAAAYAARQQAYRAQAQTETRELANAIRAYWVTYGAWPNKLQSFAGNANNYVSLSESLMEDLTGTQKTGIPGGNARGLTFMDISSKHFGPDNSGASGSERMYLDPWGNAYQISLANDSVSRVTSYRTGVAFPMRNRTKNP